MISCQTLFSFVSAGLSFVAAIFWYFSATAKVQPSNQPDNDGLFPASIEVNGSDFIASAIKQQNLSRKGAYFAALGGIFQGLAIVLSAIAKG